jgi:hypothetical protein
MIIIYNNTLEQKMTKDLTISNICRQNIFNKILQDDINVANIFKISLFRLLGTRKILLANFKV